MSRRIRANSIIQINNHSAFPRHFAVCRSQSPIQFQLLYLDNSFTYRNGAEMFRLENDTSDNIDQMFVEHHHNYERNVSRGDFYIWNQMTGHPQRIRYELYNIYLRNDHKILPIALLDTMSCIPTPEFMIIPQNVRGNSLERALYEPRFSEDPYYLMRNVLNRDNFREPEHFGYNHHPDMPPLLQASDYEHYFESRRRALEHEYPDDQFVGAGSGPGYDRPRTRQRQVRHERVVQAVERQPPQQPESVQRPSTSQHPELQAFTIQALIHHAINEKMNCPISMNPIEATKASVTVCQHVFDKESIQRWFETHSTCPVCRKETRICN